MILVFWGVVEMVSRIMSDDKTRRRLIYLYTEKKATVKEIIDDLGISQGELYICLKRLGLRRYNKGFKIDKDGYVLVKCPGHPYAQSGSHYYQEHRLVMEKKLGRYLDPEEVVHHKNGNRRDNRLKNLRLFKNNSAHITYHAMLRRQKRQQRQTA